MPEKIKVLAIDDEIDFGFFVRENLMRNGLFDVVLASNGRSGIKLAVEAKPDIILLDLVMPDMSGEDVAATLRENPETEDIPIIFLTALATEDSINVGKYGENYMLAKPLRTKKLIKTIQKILKIPQE